MDSPQFSGLILAYLRGVLKPGYPNGRTSYIREQLLIAALQKEELARTYDNMAKTAAAALTNYTDHGKRAKLKEMLSHLVQSHMLRNQHSLKRAKNESMDAAGAKSVKQMLAAYKVLSKTALSDRLEQVVNDL